MQGSGNAVPLSHISSSLTESWYANQRGKCLKNRNTNSKLERFDSQAYRGRCVCRRGDPCPRVGGEMRRWIVQRRRFHPLSVRPHRSIFLPFSLFRCFSFSFQRDPKSIDFRYWSKTLNVVVKVNLLFKTLNGVVRVNLLIKNPKRRRKSQHFSQTRGFEIW